MGFSLSVMHPEHSRTYDGGEVAFVQIADQVDPIEIGIVRRKGAIRSGIILKFAEFCLRQI